MKLFTNKYKEAQLWREQSSIREEKRKAVQPVFVTQESTYVPEAVLSQSRTVFTKEDKGYDQEETRQIQAISMELGDVIRLARLTIG